jgi:hypothetical protein
MVSYHGDNLAVSGVKYPLDMQADMNVSVTTIAGCADRYGAKGLALVSL